MGGGKAPTLWVDGTKIYAAKGLALRIVDDG